MPTRISTVDGVICGWKRCGLPVFTSEDGNRVLHWVPADQPDRLLRPDYSDSAVQLEALDRDGTAHVAELPDRLPRHLR